MAIQVLDAVRNEIPVKFTQFSGGERHVQIDETTLGSLSGKVLIRAKMASSHDVMDYLLLENILLTQGLIIDLEIPYFPYARQDRICAVGQAFSLDVMTKLLNINADKKAGKQGKITVWDCHSEVTTALLAANTSFSEKVLNERVGLIYGDSITLDHAQRILERLEAKGFASNNLVFGIGSFTYNYLTRDTFGFAVKATWGQVNGVGRELFKDPITDSGVKKSAKGLLRIEESENGFTLFDEQTAEQEQGGALKTVFENGKLQYECTLDQIRERLSIA